MKEKKSLNQLVLTQNGFNWDIKFQSSSCHSTQFLFLFSKDKMSQQCGGNTFSQSTRGCGSEWTSESEVSLVYMRRATQWEALSLTNKKEGRWEGKGGGDERVLTTQHWPCGDSNHPQFLHPSASAPKVLESLPGVCVTIMLGLKKASHTIHLSTEAKDSSCHDRHTALQVT